MTEEGQPSRPRWQWLPVHGGAGTSTLAQVDPRGKDAARLGWSEAEWTVVVCRTHAAGLLRAKEAASWPGQASRVIGLVTVADAPGRLPTGLRHLRRHTTGGYRYVWHVDWVEAWRCGEPVTAASTPRSVRALMAQIADRVATATPVAAPLNGARVGARSA